MQPGDVPRTFAYTEKPQSLTGYHPCVEVDEGVEDSSIGTLVPGGHIFEIYRIEPPLLKIRAMP